MEPRAPAAAGGTVNRRLIFDFRYSARILEGCLRLLIGLCLLLTAASCATPEVQVASSAQALAKAPPPPSTGSVIRIGVEYLPPDAGLPSPAGLHESLFGSPRPESAAHPDVVVGQPWEQRPPTPESRNNLGFSGLQARWELERAEIRAKQSTLERFSLRFISELIGDDRKRVKRAIGAPLLSSQQRLSSDSLSNFLDERDHQDHQRLLTENGTRMLRRPLRNAVKELPLFSDVEIALGEIRASNVHYVQKSAPTLGRISARLRANHWEDPLELTWIRRGIRVGSTQRHLKVSYTTRLADGLSFRLRSRYDYVDYGWRLLGNLEYKVNTYTTVNAMAGNRINTLSGPATFPGGPQSDEKAKGLLLYVEHLF